MTAGPTVATAAVTGPIVVASSLLHGRGVFATRDIAEGEVLEVAPAIVLPRPDIGHDPEWSRYVFAWGDDDSHVAIAAGMASMLNHSDTPNAMVHRDEVAEAFELVSIDAIAAGAEVLIDYGPDYAFDW